MLKSESSLVAVCVWSGCKKTLFSLWYSGDTLFLSTICPKCHKRDYEPLKDFSGESEVVCAECGHKFFTVCYFEEVEILANCPKCHRSNRFYLEELITSLEGEESDEVANKRMEENSMNN